MVMLAEYGKLSLAEVLEPAIRLADGFPIEAQLANYIGRQRARLVQWPDSRRVMLPQSRRLAARAGQIFRQPDLAATLRKLVEAEKQARAAGKESQGGDLRRLRALLSRRHRAGAGGRGPRAGRALHRGRPRQLEGADRGAGQHELQRHRGLQAHALDAGPADAAGAQHPRGLRSRRRWATTARATSTRCYQAMSLAFADRDFYYGDPDFPPARADPGTALQGIRARAREAHRSEAQRPEGHARRPVSLPAHEESVPRPAAALARAAQQGAAQRRDAHGGQRSLRGQLLLCRHHLRRRRGQGGLGRLHHAERRLGAGGDRGAHRHRAIAAHAELRARRRARIPSTWSSPASGRA